MPTVDKYGYHYSDNPNAKRGQCPVCGGLHLAKYRGTAKRPHPDNRDKRDLAVCTNCDAISVTGTGMFTGSIHASDQDVAEERKVQDEEDRASGRYDVYD